MGSFNTNFQDWFPLDHKIETEEDDENIQADAETSKSTIKSTSKGVTERSFAGSADVVSGNQSRIW